MNPVNVNVNSFFSSITYQIQNCLIDPGDIQSGFPNTDFVLLTHAHFDHIYGINEIIRLNPDVRIYTNEYGRDLLLDAKKNLSHYHESPFVISNPDSISIIENKENIRLNDDITVKAIFTPGHNPSCITWLIDDYLFTGDAYIPGIKTVTSLPGGNKQQAEASIELIKRLAEGRRIFPGHAVTH